MFGSLRVWRTSLAIGNWPVEAAGIFGFDQFGTSSAEEIHEGEAEGGGYFLSGAGTDDLDLLILFPPSLLPLAFGRVIVIIPEHDTPIVHVPFGHVRSLARGPMDAFDLRNRDGTVGKTEAEEAETKANLRRLRFLRDNLHELLASKDTEQAEQGGTDSYFFETGKQHETDEEQPKRGSDYGSAFHKVGDPQNDEEQNECGAKQGGKDLAHGFRDAQFRGVHRDALPVC
jgi:hypothetical protein